MTATWSSCPFERTVRLEELGPLGSTLSQHNGESRRVSVLEQHPDWVFKEYLSPKLADDNARLSHLITLPTQMDPAADRPHIDHHTAWPAARVVDERQRAVGVLMPKAPDLYHTTFRLRSGNMQRKPLHVDLLALTAEEQSKRGLTGQALTDRLKVCASIAAVGAVLERHGVVYLDWSYANVFWSVLDLTAFVIDLDGCSFGPREQIESHGWADPLVARGRSAGNEVDRYRVALLTARCLTGTRGSIDGTREALVQVMTSSSNAVGGLAHLLTQSLTASSVADRPAIAQIDAALTDACRGRSVRAVPPVPFTGKGQDAGRVREWKPIQPKVDLRPLPPRTGPASPPRPVKTRPLTPGGTVPGTRRTPTPTPAQTPTPTPPTSALDVLAGLAGLAMSIAVIFFLAMLALDVLAFLF